MGGYDLYGSYYPNLLNSRLESLEHRIEELEKIVKKDSKRKSLFADLVIKKIEQFYIRLLNK